MRLYNITPRESIFNWPDKNGKRRIVEITGQWLGTVGKRTKPQFIPIFVGTEAPNESHWGIESSETGRPKIVANSDDTPGVIALISTYVGNGHEIGRGFVHQDCLDDVMLVAHGIGGNDSLAIRYHEYLVQVHDQAQFLILGTRKPYYYLTLTAESEIMKSQLVLPDFEKDYVVLDDQAVANWRKIYGR